MEEKEIIDVEIKEQEIKPEVKETKKKHGFIKMAALVLVCALVSGGAGYAGASYALSNGSARPKTEVLYQSVMHTNADGTQADELSVADVAATVKDSVVEITTSTVQTNLFMQQFVTSGAGSGVIISSEGLVITNHHVIDGATSITVRTSDGTEHEAALIASDPQTDVAVLKINATGLQPALIGDSDRLVVGQEVVAIGNPLGSLGGTVTEGIVSALDREITIDGQTMTLLQTSAAINPGNSGGGLFNTKGELIGIVNAKSSGTNVEGLGFAIPINIAKTVAQDLIELGKVSGRVTLGIRYLEISNIQQAAQYNVNVLGLYVDEVIAGSNAERAGIQAGDIIVAADGQQITTSAELKKALNGHKVGEVMEFSVVRDRQYVDLSVTLAD